ncbi:MAG: hypothetical protein INR64_18725 [Caulobacteraceae bacterium]|nr:hypothetical protein [Caulobacter sp.]
MPNLIPSRALVIETAAATLLSAGALAVMAAVERRGPLQPLNATSHWLNGDEVADVRGPGWRTTGVGFGTHLAATAFWAAIFQAWMARGSRSAANIAGKAVAMAGISAVVDYRATPKRFTPGWEFVLSPGSMVVAYAAMSIGFAIGAAASE